MLSRMGENVTRFRVDFSLVSLFPRMDRLLIRVDKPADCDVDESADFETLLRARKALTRLDVLWLAGGLRCWW